MPVLMWAKRGNRGDYINTIEMDDPDCFDPDFKPDGIVVEKCIKLPNSNQVITTYFFVDAETEEMWRTKKFKTCKGSTCFHILHQEEDRYLKMVAMRKIRRNL